MRDTDASSPHPSLDLRAEVPGLACAKSGHANRTSREHMKQFEHSVINVARGLHEHVTGSADGYTEEEYVHFVRWLEWRVLEGWSHRPNVSTAWTAYDNAVRKLAIAALDVCREFESQNQERNQK